MKLNFLGATIIAALIYFLLSFLSDVWLTTPRPTTLYAFLTSLAKTAVFAILFHYIHNFIANLLNWYDEDDDDELKPRVFDRTPSVARRESQ